MFDKSFWSSPCIFLWDEVGKLLLLGQYSSFYRAYIIHYGLRSNSPKSHRQCNLYHEIWILLSSYCVQMWIDFSSIWLILKATILIVQLDPALVCITWPCTRHLQVIEESPTFRLATFRFRRSDRKLSVWWHMRLTAHQSGDTIDLQPISLVTHLDLSPWASLSDLRNEFFVKFPMWSGFHAENFNTSRELELAANRAELVNQAEPIPGPDHDQKMSTFFKK